MTGIQAQNGVADEKFGRRLMPRVLQDEAEHSPNRVFAATPRSEDLKEGFRDVTFAEIASAVNATAHSIVRQFGQPKREFETLTFLGPLDIRYSIVFYATVKAGYKAFFPSPRNPASTTISLMEQLESVKLLYSREMEKAVEPLHDQIAELASSGMPSLETLLSSPAEPFPFTKSFDEAEMDQVLVLHSSGSTGTPKPIVMTHGTFAVYDNDRNFPKIPGRKNQDLTIWDFEEQGCRIYEPFPPFHIAGFFNKVVIPVFSHTIPIFGPSTRPPSGVLAAQIMSLQDVRGSVLPPVIVEQLYQEPGGFEILKKLHTLGYAGGPLSEAVGNELIKHMILCQFYGSTEAGQAHQLVPEREDWSYIQFHPHMKFELQSAEDGAYELVYFADESTKRTCALNHNLPGVREWRTKDLFKPHPTKPDLWRFHARRDDIIVLSNGEKLNPIPIEGALLAVPAVSGALVAGQGRPYPVLLIEVKPNGTATEQIVDKDIWSAIEEANKLVPKYGKITKSAVLFAESGKPFVRAGKGTVIRKLTEAAYSEEIRKLYTTHSIEPLLKVQIFDGTTVSRARVRDLLYSLFEHIAPEVELSADNDNFYMSGIDSRATIELVNQLKASLSSSFSSEKLEWLGVDFFYHNPTMNQVVSSLLLFLNQGTQPKARDRLAEMRRALELYTRDLTPRSMNAKIKQNFGSIVVAVTGTTGYTGGYLLSSLMRNSCVSKIYCLNRSPDAEAKWREITKTFHDKLPEKSVKFVRINFGEAELGINPAQYAEIIQDCDVLIHNAWTVDFNWSFSSFEANLKGVRSIVDMSVRSAKQFRILFLSTVSATGLWSLDTEGIVVPEASVKDLDQATAMGYAESKLVAEQILQAAADIAGIPVTTLRIGQIGPSTNPDDMRWPELDLVTAILRTSKMINIVPSELGDVDWMPIDKLVLAIAEIMLHDPEGPSSQGARYYNIVNPSNVPWANVLPALQVWCGPTVRTLPFSLWAEELFAIGEGLTLDEQANLPALKTKHVIDMLAAGGTRKTYETVKAQVASKTLRDLPPIDASMFKQWIQGL